MSAPDSRTVDAADLPAHLIELIDGLGPGDEIVITRNGQPIATIVGSTESADAIDATGSADRSTEPEPVICDDVTIVATAMKLSSSARGALSTELGPDYVVLDLHHAPRTADVLLVPPSSPQLIQKLRTLYPQARLVVTEIQDDVLGVNYEGPIRRMLNAGAETYLAPGALPRLARQLDHVLTRRNTPLGTADAPPEIDATAQPDQTVDTPGRVPAPSPHT